MEIRDMCLLRRDRVTRGGGVALYFHRHFTCRQITDEDLDLQDTMWCSLKMLDSTECIVGVIYRSPTADMTYNSKLMENIRLVAARYRTRILIMGDFNLPNLSKTSTHPENSLENNFQRLLEDIPLFNHTTCNTRFRGNDVPSTLDLILCSEDNVVEDISYNPPMGLSDHLVLIFDYVCRAERQSDACKLIRKVNIRSLSDDLRNFSNWSTNYTDVNEHWLETLDKIQEKISSHSQFVPKKDKQQFHFHIRSRTRKWIKLRNKAWWEHKNQQHPTIRTWEIYRLLRNKVNTLIREEKQLYQSRLIYKMECNPKLLYQMVNSFTRVKPGVSALHTPDGMTSSASETAQQLADFYSSVYCPNDVIHLHPESHGTSSVNVDKLILSPKHVLDTLLKLNSKSSPGADEITPFILKSCALFLFEPLTKLFNLSLQSSVVPQEWKRGMIVPIYKGGNRSSISNYRPVTLLSVISKVLERLVANELVKHLEVNGLLATSQHGFRKHHSCLTNLLLTLDDWTAASDRGISTHACYLDMSKAFDRVNHNILLQKLKQHGVTGQLLSWLQNYLTDRVAQVRVDGALSSPFLATSGVPQGSVLGPILFLIYVNDIPNLIHSKIALFADDIKIWTNVRTASKCTVLQQDLDVLYEWSLQNKIPFNLQKCKMLSIGKQYDRVYSIGPHQLTWTHEEKDLGVWINTSLKTSRQCTVVYKKTSKILGLLKRIFGQFSKQTLPRLMNTYIRPTMEYAIQAWSPWLQKDIDLMQRIYHRATKVVAGLQHRPYLERIASLNLFDFNYRRFRGDMILVYTILNTPDHPLRQLLVRREAGALRSNENSLAIPHSRLNCRRYFFTVRVCFSWNSLPCEVVQSPNLKLFKFNLDAFMCNTSRVV